MMSGRMAGHSINNENPLGLSWHDSNWIPILNPSNVMDYFSQRSNPFFDDDCNNEKIKMQRLNPELLNNMTGVEYILLHVQEPILYVIRKQHRHSTSQVTPLADYYIIAGIIYQAPDLASVMNSRLLSAVHHLQSSFEETASYSRYHPSKGYSWDFKPNKSGLDRGALGSNLANQNNGNKDSALTVPKEEPSTLFQRQRVDMLLAELVRQFPLPATTLPDTKSTNNNNVTIKSENQSDRNQDTKPPENTNITIKQEPGEPAPASNTNGVTLVANGPSSGNNVQLDIVKQECMKPPPEKKPRLN